MWKNGWNPLQFWFFGCLSGTRNTMWVTCISLLRIVAVRYDDVMTSSISCYGVNGTSIANSHCQLAAALIKLHNGQPNPGKVPEWKKNSSNHKGVKDTLYYYNDMIVCCAFGGMLATKRFFRTISTPINDNNGIRGANQPMKYPQNQGISV